MKSTVAVSLALFVFLCLVQSAQALDADQALKQSGLTGGFAVFAPGNAATEAMALAKHPKWTVLWCAKNDEAARQAQRTAYHTGLLNTRFYVTTGAPEVATASVDLVVCAQAPTATQKDELLSLLVHRRGVLLAPGVRLQAKAPEGGDQWTHRFHDADNNFLSGDTRWKPPFLTQWWGLPIHDSFWGTTVLAAGGRYAILDGSSRARRAPKLTIRSLGNGAVLWQRDLEVPESTKPGSKRFGKAYNTGRTGAVLTEDEILIIDSDAVLCLDAETGRKTARIPGPLPGGQVKWISVDGNRLAMLSGPPDIAEMHIYYVASENAHGNHLAVYDLSTQKKLWAKTTTAPIDERQLTIADGCLYSVEAETAVRCRAVQSGKTIWSNTEPKAIQALGWKKKISGLFVTQRALMINDGILFYGASYTENFVSFDAESGKLLSVIPMKEKGRGIKGIIENGRWIGAKYIYNIRNGKEVEGMGMLSGSCGPSLATPQLFAGGFGNVQLRSDGSMIRETDVKSPCDIGMIICDGIALSAASTCVCNLEMRGYRAFAHAGAIKPHSRPAGKRLSSFDSTTAASDAADAKDWPVMRHDVGRGSASPVTVGGEPALRWRWKPTVPVSYEPSEYGGSKRSYDSAAPDIHGSPIIAVGDAVYFGDAYGVLRCANAADGNERWAYPTSGPILHAPSYWQGRIYQGDSDGRLHCIDAASGKTLWQFDAAPARRRIFWYSKLINTWPLLSSVTIHDGKLFAVAGYQQDNGIHVWCLDPVTGKELWSKHDTALGTKEGGLSSGLGAYGYSCIADDKLFLASGTVIPARFDPTSGNWACPPRAKRDHVTRRGAGVGAFAPGWVLSFDRRLSFVHDLWGKRDKGLGRTFSRSNFAGKGWAAIGLPGNVSMAPAWDQDLAIMTEGEEGPLVAIAMKDLLAALKKETSAPLGKRPHPAPNKILAGRSFKAEELPLPKQWGPVDLECLAVVLTADAVVATHATGNWDKRHRRFSIKGWGLSAIDRRTGKVRWQLPLPEQPIVAHLTVDRHGHILVGLRDGSVMAFGE